MRKWTVCYDVPEGEHGPVEAHVEVTVTAKDINEAMEKASQYYACEKWLLTDVTSYEI